jgi:hypothetical protein
MSEIVQFKTLNLFSPQNRLAYNRFINSALLQIYFEHNILLNHRRISNLKCE